MSEICACEWQPAINALAGLAVALTTYLWRREHSKRIVAESMRPPRR